MSTPSPLQATERDETLNPRQLRKAGFVPGTLYANGIPSRSIQVRTHEFSQLLLRGVRDFELVGLNVTATVQQLQMDAVNQVVLHVEFLQTSPLPASSGGKAQAQKPAKAEKSKSPAEPQPKPAPELAVEAAPVA